MESNLEHEDLLIKLRAKLNEEKIKLWEAPYLSENGDISQSLKDLSHKLSASLNLDSNIVLQGLRELQIHSIERSKANEEFKETGCATLRVKATKPREKPQIFKILKPLSIMGEELFSSIAHQLNMTDNRIKMIYNGKLIIRNKSLEEQGVKNGAQLMALILAESPEIVKKEDNMYMEMKSTLEDATLLTDYVDDLAENDEYMKLEDQSGKAVELPQAEKRALLVGLALHERGRAAVIKRDYSLALVLLLEADRQFSECRSSILNSVDNWAILQLDISWCYLCLQSLSSALDASARLSRAEKSFTATYGEQHQRLIALKGTNANERVLFMRLYLLQGIVAYHQNKRVEARALLDKAEAELNYLRVDETSVEALMELGWSAGQARTGLRAAGGDLDRAHHYLEDKRREREDAREKHKLDREQDALGKCEDGSPVSLLLVHGLHTMGFPRRLAVVALSNSNNNVTDAVRFMQDQPELLAASDSEDDEQASSSDDSIVEPDNRLAVELEAMGYPAGEARAALRRARNNVDKAVDLLVGGCTQPCDPSNPSTSAASPSRKKIKKETREKKKKEREMALRRLKKSIRGEEDDYLSAALADEEQFLVQYKSLLN